MEGKVLEIRHSIPSGLQSLLADLNFLSQIKRNQKPCVSNRVIVDGDTWFGAFYRFMKGENKSNVISKVEQIFSQTMDAIDAHKDSDHIKIIINYAASARDGVANLKETYGEHPDILARINVQLDNIDLQLDRFRHLIKGYKKEVEDEPFPGLNSESIDLMDSSMGEGKKFRRARLKRSQN